MNFLFNLKVVLTLIIIENFFYKYYIGVNFFTELHKGEIKKEKISMDFFILLSGSSFLLYFLEKIYHAFFENNAAQLILVILSSYLMIIFYEIFLGKLSNRLYFAVNIFLLLSIIENRFDNYLAKILAIIFIPLFYYINLVILEPLLKSLKYKKKSVFVKDDAIIVIVIALVGLLLNAFDGL